MVGARQRRGFRAMAAGLSTLSQSARCCGCTAIQSLEWHKANLDRARSAWQDCYARVEGLRKLVQRYMDEARRLEDKREQKLLDELSQRLPRHEQF